MSSILHRQEIVRPTSTGNHFTEDMLSAEVSRVLHSPRQKEGKKIALFDFDGTLIEGDLGESVYGALLRRGVPLKMSWEEYQSAIRGNRAKSYADMVRAMSGASVEDVLEVTRGFMKGTETSQQMNGELIPAPLPRTMMKTLVSLLQDAGVRCYVISASNAFSIKLAAEEWFGIPSDHAFGITPVVRNGKITGRLQLPVPIGEGKAELFRHKISTHAPIFVAGDSLLDLPMMSLIDPAGTCLWLGKEPIAMMQESLPKCRVIPLASVPDSQTTNPL